jgi:hypothetical protein
MAKKQKKKTKYKRTHKGKQERKQRRDLNTENTMYDLQGQEQYRAMN